MIDIRTNSTAELSHAELRAIRHLLDSAFVNRFSDEDWDHTVGGVHVLAVEGGHILSHASVVERALVAGERRLRTGYVEGVGTAPDRQGRGLASGVMRVAGEVIQSRYELGGLSTDLTGFYERLGWETWRGPTYTSAPDGVRRTEDDDGGVMVLRTKGTRDLDPTTPLTCDWRSGDVW